MLFCPLFRGCKFIISSTKGNFGLLKNVLCKEVTNVIHCPFLGGFFKEKFDGITMNEVESLKPAEYELGPGAAEWAGLVNVWISTAHVFILPHRREHDQKVGRGTKVVPPAYFWLMEMFSLLYQHNGS